MAELFTKLIIRPPRYLYDENKIPINIDNLQNVKREKINFRNSRNQNIVGSFFKPSIYAPGNPCVIYLHGNTGCQFEGMFLPILVNSIGISVLTIDLSGSGLSDGEYISLGYNERDDVRSACDFIRKNYNTENIVLWGRSMGAALALWCGCDSSIKITAIIADSPYSSFKAIVDDLSKRSIIFRVIKSLFYKKVVNNVKKILGIHPDDINIINDIHKAAVPALFLHSIDDDVISIDQCVKLFSKYGYYHKYIHTVRGLHDSIRGKASLTLQVSFLLNVLDLDVDIEIDNNIETDIINHYRDVFTLKSTL